MRPNEPQVLEFCNALREKYGIGDQLPEMPPDLTEAQWKEDGETLTIHCPVALALGQQCAYTGARFASAGGYADERFPDFVREFMTDHDRRFNAKLVEAEFPSGDAYI